MGNELFTELESKPESEVIGYGDPVETCSARHFCSGVISVGVYLLAWLVAQLFPVTMQRWQRIREEISHSRGMGASSRTSHTEETEEERHRRVLPKTSAAR